MHFRVLLVKMASLVHLEQQVKLVLEVVLVCLVSKDLKVIAVLMAKTEQRVNRACLVKRDHLGYLDKWDLPDLWYIFLLHFLFFF